MKAVIALALAAPSAAISIGSDERDHGEALLNANIALKEAIDALEESEGGMSTIVGLTEKGKNCLKLMADGEKTRHHKVKDCTGFKQDGDDNKYPLECEEGNEVFTASPYEGCWGALIQDENMANKAICSEENYISMKAVQKWCNEVQNANPNYSAYKVDGNAASFPSWASGKAQQTYEEDYDGRE